MDGGARQRREGACEVAGKKPAGVESEALEALIDVFKSVIRTCIPQQSTIV